MAICLVTGGAGFIGSHLVERLLGEGHRVRVLDNLGTGSRSNLAAAPEAELIIGDVGDEKLVRTAARGVDLVFHLAAVPSVPESVADPLEAHRVCATGTLNVLTAALDGGARRVVYAATSSVYGNAPPAPSREDHTPAAVAPYPVAKLVGEHYCRMFAEAYGLPTVCLRYFHVFGPRQKPGGPYAGAIPLFIDAMLDGRPPMIYGDGMQSRDFIDVEDAVRAALLAASARDVSGNSYNIGRGVPVSLLAVVAALNEILGTQIQPSFAPPRVADLRHSVADIVRARVDLGFEPALSLEEGLYRCVESRRKARCGSISARSAAGMNDALIAPSR